MRKIPTVFARDPETGLVVDEVRAGCEWVLEGEGAATRKYNGVCVMMDRLGRWWVRLEVRPGAAPPRGFHLVEKDGDVRVGWEPGTQSRLAKPLMDAVTRCGGWFKPGTYELCGPRIYGNPEGVPRNTLVRHDRAQVLEAPDRSFDGLARLLTEGFPHEGIVFRHRDGRAAKIKRLDFGAEG